MSTRVSPNFLSQLLLFLQVAQRVLLRFLGVRNTNGQAFFLFSVSYEFNYDFGEAFSIPAADSPEVW